MLKFIAQAQHSAIISLIIALFYLVTAGEYNIFKKKMSHFVAGDGCLKNYFFKFKLKNYQLSEPFFDGVGTD